MPGTTRREQVCKQKGAGGDAREDTEVRQRDGGEVGEGARGAGGGWEGEEGWKCQRAECV
jgi:hypothetical protein